MLLCLVVCLTLLSSSFLHSHLSLKYVYVYLVDVYVDVYVQVSCIYLVDGLSTTTNEATVDSTINLHLVNNLVFLKAVRRGGGEGEEGEGK